MDRIIDYLLMCLSNAWAIWQAVAPWLILGLIIAGLLKAFLPDTVLKRWLGGTGIGPVFKAAVIGTPLPLCSCSVLPTAIQLHRSGASNGATTSFLVATPENGADSMALTYVLLGPVMTIVRPVAAILSAVLTGLLAQAVSQGQNEPSNTSDSASTDPCCCCAGDSAAAREDGETADNKPGRRNLGSVTSTAIDLFDDIAGWLLAGILLAAAVKTFVPADAMAHFGSGLLPMLAIAAVSVPMYICATASTPVAASMLLAGMSPGTALVFLLAGPATNVASAAIIWRELGGRVTIAYLIGVVGSAICLGLVLDMVLNGMDIQVTQQIGSACKFVPDWISFPAAVILGLLALRPVRQKLWTPGSSQ